MTDVFSVNWPNHERDRTVAVKDMLAKGSFVDVTLACDDDQLEAHKVILSSASPFFHKILQRNPHSHPLLYLRGSLKKDVSALLNLIYSGETLVPVEDLESFLTLARDLGVKGLVDEQVFNEKEQNKETKASLQVKLSETARSIKEYKQSSDPSEKKTEKIDPEFDLVVLSEVLPKLNVKKQYRKFKGNIENKKMTNGWDSGDENTRATHIDDAVEEIYELDHEIETNLKRILNVDNVDVIQKTDNDGGALKSKKRMKNNDPLEAELDQKIASLIFKTEEGFWSCSECAYNSRNKGHVREHAENHIEGYFHPCQTCGRAFPKRISLRQHAIKCRKTNTL
eukprot:GFUD01002768.1.p1 GENE.GFUD01002768.1~~GFUD01002768.1.p1  ORF type:complete len:359 (+),score=68.24 GFUD01002768.1:61-1077(+)